VAENSNLLITAIVKKCKVTPHWIVGMFYEHRCKRDFCFNTAFLVSRCPQCQDVCCVKLSCFAIFTSGKVKYAIPKSKQSTEIKNVLHSFSA